METLTCKIPDALLTKLDSYATQKHTSKSEIVRTALMEFLNRGDIQEAKSFFELSNDLAGSVDGPSDLASNQKYYDGYGQ